MKKKSIHISKKVVLIFSFLFSLSLFVFLTYTPSKALSLDISKSISLSTQITERLSDHASSSLSVTTTQEIGLPYLSQEPVLLADYDIIQSIRYAEEKVARLPEDIPLAFDLGTNYPVRIGSFDDDSSIRSDYKAIGYVDTRGKARTFDSDIISEMFSSESRNGGRLAFLPDYEVTNLLADASGNLAQASRDRFFTLVVYSEEDNEIYSVSEVNPNTVCRDALNGVLNETMIRLPSNILRRF
jgi:hypothetical protein